MSEPHAGKRIPRPSATSAAYWEGCQNRQLLIQRCKQCKHVQFYPRSICTSCMRDDLEMVQASGAGKITTFSIIRHPVSQAYANEVPYAIALIELDEGPTMMSAICNADPETVHTGMTVKVVFEQWTDEITMPKFQPVATD
jgi:uncharacterized OB-fold protein